MLPRRGVPPAAKPGSGGGSALPKVGTLSAVKRYFVTTFGCQMNAHDSERIKGMLESIGLGEAVSQDEADVVVFNTCTIREKPDQRLAAHLAQAKALKDRDPERVIAVGGCYAEAQRERIFEHYPFVDVAFGPGSIPHLGDWLTGDAPAQRVRDGGRAPVLGDAPAPPRAAVPGLGADLDGLQLEVRVLHRSGRARPGGEPAAGRDRRRDHRAGRRGRPRGDAARPERELVRPGPPAGHARRLRGAAPCGRRGRGDRADPLHEPASEGLSPRRDRRDGRVPRRVRARAPAAPVRLDRGS